MDSSEVPSSYTKLCVVLTSIHSGGTGLTVLQVTALVSSVLRDASSSLVGWSSICTCSHANQGGPLHHSGWSLNAVGDSPLEAQSAGFCSVGTCFQDSGGNRFVMAEMRLATKVLYCFGASNHARTMELSLQAWTCSRGMFSDVLTVVSNFDSKDAPHNSSRGTEMVFTGATLVLVITKRQVGSCTR